MEVKTEVNGASPLPQRPPKGGAALNKKAGGALQLDAPAEKKPRFIQNNSGNQGGGGGPNQSNRGGFANKGFMNRNNRNKNFRGGLNQQKNQQQNQQQQQQQPQNQVQSNQADQSMVETKPTVAAEQGGGGTTSAQPNAQPKDNNNANAPQQQQQQNFNNQQRQNQNRGHGGRGGGGGGNNMQGGHGRQNQRNNNQQGGGNQGNRDRSSGGGGGGAHGGKDFRAADEYHIMQRLRNLNGPTNDLPPVNIAEEPKFSGRNRLYVGNLTNDTTEAELHELFAPYGEISEIFRNTEKNFTFLKVDYHSNAEKAKRELDGKNRKGRQLRVRFAPNATIVRVRNLTPFVSNELLYRAFEVFGPLERAMVEVDDRGNSTGKGIVEFSKKSSTNTCLRFCTEKCFFLTASLRPCIVEAYEPNCDNDGLPDKSISHKQQEYNAERRVGPRCAEIGSFEHDYGCRWKQMYELFRSKKELLKRELAAEEEKLQAQMEFARYEHETEALRQELRKRESDNERKKLEWEMREKKAEEMRKREEETISHQTNELQSRMSRQEEDMRRRQQENTLFMQAQQLNSLLDQQENFSFDGFGNNNNNNNNNAPFDFRAALSNLGGNGNNGNGPAGNMGGGPNNNNGQEQFSFDFGGQGNQRNNNGGNNIPWERRNRRF